MAATGAAGRVILLLNGPNLNTLGQRDPRVYGTTTLAEVEELARAAATAAGVDLVAKQTNHEGEMLEWIHGARGTADAIVINPGAWTHTSIALRDALEVPGVPIVEVHISNIHAREEFRHTSFVSPIAAAVIAGCGVSGYRYAVDRAAELIAALADSGQ